MASVYILGAGAMGSLWATHLHQAFQEAPEHSLKFLSSRQQAMREMQFSLHSPFLSATCREFTTRLQIAQPADLQKADSTHPALILLCTKSYNALAATLALKPFLNKHCALLLFQNGLGSQYQILEALGDIPVFAAVSTEGVNRIAERQFTHAGQGLTRIGPLNQAASQPERFDACIKLLSHPGIATQAFADIWRALWEKLAINCAINPFTAILNCPNGEIKRAPFFQQSWPELKQELSIMLELAGVQTNPDILESRVFQVIEATGKNISSMLQDIRAERKTEIADINGFAAKFLEDKGVSSRINALLHHRVLSLSRHD